MDHIKHGFNTRYFVRPPKVEDNVDDFADGLKDIIPQKLKLLIDRQDELVLIREKALTKIDEKIDNNPTLEYIYLYSIEADFAEYFIVQRWLRYWLKLLTKADANFQLTEQNDDISEEDIARAREVPIEDLYNGRLRGNTRLVGVCPFHEEKTPSFTIFTDDNRFYCFGCNVHGDVIDYYMQENKVSFPEAVKSLNG